MIKKDSKSDKGKSSISWSPATAIFVLYRPPVQGNTLLLWGGPIALLILVVVVAWFSYQRRRAETRRRRGQATIRR